MLANSCEICGSEKLQPIKFCEFYTKGQPIHVCEGCGFVQVLERRSPEAIYEAWTGCSPGDDIYLSSNAAVAARHAYVAQFMLENIKPGDMIDVGAADGAFGKMLGWMGMEMAPYNYNGMAEDLDDLPTLDTGLYDTATLLWTLENCGSATAVIDACKRILKPGGHLVVATGSRILVPYKKPLHQYLGPAPVDLHSWRFTEHTLGHLLNRCGFTVTKTNDFIGCDYLVMIAENKEPRGELSFLDNHLAVIDYFERWHRFTQGYHVA